MSQENFRLHVYTSSHDLIAEKPGGVGINKPIVRKCGILDNLKQVSSNVEFNYISDATKDLSLATCVHSKGFVHFMETAWDRWSKEIKSGLADTYFAPESYDKDPDPSIVPVFLPSQIRASDNPWQRPGKSVYGEICYYAMDRMTPIDGDTSNTLKHDMMINIAAIEAVIRKKQTQVYALTTQPGHHASRECYGGYCYINNSAIISKQLCEHYKRIAHLDIDYHAGNGTMAIFYSDPNILFASIHADPDYEYPYTSGFADQTGEGDAKGLTINVPLPGGTTWKQYEIELKKVLDQMREWGAEALVVSLGIDTVRDDPEANKQCAFCLDGDDYIEMGNLIRSLNVPTIWVQEGGYKLDVAGDRVRRLLTGK